MRLADKVAVVTGAASGIGRAIAERFAAEGASVAVVDRNVEGAEETVRNVMDGGGHAVHIESDLAVAGEAESMIQEAIRRLGKLDVLVNNAATLIPGDITQLTHRDWDRIFNTNVRAVAFACKESIVHMRERGTGSIVNVASTAALVGEAGIATYIASKGALIALTKALAVDHARDGIRVNCLCPGSIHTPLTEALLAPLGDRADYVMEELVRAIPMSRQGHPNEISNAALYLASEEASYVTGSVLVVDGGFTLGWGGVSGPN